VKKQRGKEQVREGDALVQSAVCPHLKTVSLLLFLEA